MSLANGTLGHLPTGWQLAKLDDLKAASRYSFVGGPFGSNLTRDDYVAEPGVPVIRGTNLGGDTGQFVDDDFVYVTEEKADSLVQNLAYPGDLVFTQRGTLGQVAEIPSTANHGRYVVSQSQMKLTVDGAKAIPRFVYYYYRSPRAVSYLSQRTQATGVPHINLDILKEFPIILPPIEQQRRIAAILDKADAIRRKREEGIRLTEELLRSTFLEMFGDPATNPMGWGLLPISELVSEMEGGKSLLADAAETESGRYRVLKVSAVTCADYRPHESKPVPSGYVPPASHVVKQGDLLFSRANTTELVGATVYVFDTPPNHLLPDKLWRFVWRDPHAVEPQYIRALFMTTAMKRELGKRATGTSGSMKNISKAKLLMIRIPFPPIELQRKFGKFALAQQTALSARRRGTGNSGSLLNALVQRAFRGEL